MVKYEILNEKGDIVGHQTLEPSFSPVLLDGQTARVAVPPKKAAPKPVLVEKAAEPEPKQETLDEHTDTA